MRFRVKVDANITEHLQAGFAGIGVIGVSVGAKLLDMHLYFREYRNSSDGIGQAYELNL